MKYSPDIDRIRSTRVEAQVGNRLRENRRAVLRFDGAGLVRASRQPEGTGRHEDPDAACPPSRLRRSRVSSSKHAVRPFYTTLRTWLAWPTRGCCAPSRLDPGPPLLPSRGRVGNLQARGHE